MVELKKNQVSIDVEILELQESMIEKMYASTSVET